MTLNTLNPLTRRAAGARLGALGAFAATFLLSPQVFAQGSATQGQPLMLIAVLAGLSLVPFLLVMVTSFVKVAVVLSLLRTAIGAQQVPPNQVITGLAVVLSAYIMAPVALDTYDVIAPMIERIEQVETQGGEAIKFAEYRDTGLEAAKPLKAFLLKHADEKERVLLYELAIELRTESQRKDVSPDDMLVVIPAFVLTELKEAFTIGFLLFIPFLIVDLVVANILLSLGMHMLSPTTVSLPFKLLLFVLVDGWYLVIKGLILGYL